MLRKILFLVLMLGAGQVFADVTVVDVPGEASTTFAHIGAAQGSTFTDTWSLDVTDKAAAIAGAVSLSLAKTYGITDFALSVFDVATSTYLAVTELVTDSGTYWSFTIPSSGLYDLLISGTISGSSGGAYVAGIVTAAIPEPGVYLLILVGLVGLFISKRQRSTRIPTMMQAA